MSEAIEIGQRRVMHNPLVGQAEPYTVKAPDGEDAYIVTFDRPNSEGRTDYSFKAITVAGDRLLPANENR